MWPYGGVIPSPGGGMQRWHSLTACSGSSTQVQEPTSPREFTKQFSTLLWCRFLSQYRCAVYCSLDIQALLRWVWLTSLVWCKDALGSLAFSHTFASGLQDNAVWRNNFAAGEFKEKRTRSRSLAHNSPKGPRPICISLGHRGMVYSKIYLTPPKCNAVLWDSWPFSACSGSYTECMGRRLSANICYWIWAATLWLCKLFQ